MVLSVATTTPLGLSRPSNRDWRLPTSSGGVVGATPLMALLEERDVLAGDDPLVVDGLKRSVRLDRLDRLIDTRRQRTVLLENGTHLVGLQLGTELPDDLAFRIAGELSIAHVERRAQID